MKKSELNKMTTKQLNSLFVSARDIIQDREAIERAKGLKQYLGKYFKYRNSYSCPEKLTDYWWLYYHAYEIKNNHLCFRSFEKDSRGKTLLNDSDEWSCIVSAMIEITKEEFDTALKDILQQSTLLHNALLGENKCKLD